MRQDQTCKSLKPDSRKFSALHWQRVGGSGQSRSYLRDHSMDSHSSDYSKLKSHPIILKYSFKERGNLILIKAAASNRGMTVVVVTCLNVLYEMVPVPVL